jgi:hypothetical protein
MASFNLDDYELVEVRIKKFYTDHKDGRIHTDMFFNDGKRVVFKALLYVSDLLVSTGWAEEEKGDGYVNTTSHVENCETSAVGRALANYNYSGDKRPSREEMKKVQSAQPKQLANTPKAVTSGCTCGATGNYHRFDCPMYRKTK